MVDNSQVIQPQQTSAAKPPAKRNPLYLFGILIVIVIVAAAILSMRSSNDKSPKQAAARTYSIEITSTGFVPQVLNIPAGSTVTWVNKTNDPYRIAANPQPSHSSFPALDSKDPIGPNAKYSFKFTKAGTIVYNNQFKPTKNNGEIRVTDAN